MATIIIDMIIRTIIVAASIFAVAHILTPDAPTSLPPKQTSSNFCNIVEHTETIPNTMVWPVAESEITSFFGPRDLWISPYHYGLDFGTGWNDPIPAVIGGTVVFAGWNYGNEVRIQNGQYTYLYGHLNRIEVVLGQEVAMGQVIGLSGSTGLSLGPHLHLEIWDNGVPIDPYPILKEQTQVKQNIVEKVVC